MAIGSVGESTPLFLADYRAGRATAEAGKPLPPRATAATRAGYYIRHEPVEHLTELRRALTELPTHERRILGAACQSTIAQRLPVPADEPGQLARAALVSALVALSG